MAAMAQALVSVIVPVFNVSKFLVPCIESILRQTYVDLEVILIDDGSTDASGRLCDEYAATDARVRVLHQANGGLSAARNAGLDAATGEFILCIDGDDVVAVDHVEKLVAALHEDVDIAVAGFLAIEPQSEYPQHGASARESIDFLDREEALVRLFRFKGVTNSAWAKLYRADLFDDIRYPVGALYEDLPVTYRLFDRARVVALTHYRSYFYVQRPSSITAQRQIDRRIDAFGFAAQAIEDLATDSPRVRRAARSRQFMESVFLLSEIPNSNYIKELRAEMLSPLREHRSEVLLDPESTPASRLFALAAFFGARQVHWLAVAQVRVGSLLRNSRTTDRKGRSS